MNESTTTLELTESNLETPYPEFENELKIFINKLKAYLKEESDLTKFDLSLIRREVLKSMKTKASLAKILGMGPDYRLYSVIKSDELLQQDDNYSIFCNFIDYNNNCADNQMYHLGAGPFGTIEEISYRDALNKGPIQWLTSGVYNTSEKSSTKLGRHFAKIKYLPHLWTTWINSHRTRYDSNLHEISVKKQDFNTFFSNLQAIAKNMSSKITISLNPLDILLSSESAAFDSCHEFSGCHSNGNLAYLKDDFTGIIYGSATENDRNYKAEYPYFKRSRLLFYIPSDHLEGPLAPRKRLYMARIYGVLGLEHLRDISTLITTRMAENQEIENAWIGKTTKTADGEEDNSDSYELSYPNEFLKGCGHMESGSHEKYPIYFDKAITRMVYHTSLASLGRSSNQYVPLSFRESTCLSCGDSSDRNEGFQCEACSNTTRDRCSACDCIIDTEDDDDYDCVEDDYYCNDCYDAKFFRCFQCSETHNLRDKHTILDSCNHEILICEDCHAKYKQCSVCNLSKRYLQEKLPINEGKSICTDCFRNNYSTCQACYHHHKKEVLTCSPVTSTGQYCPGCISKHFKVESKPEQTPTNTDTNTLSHTLGNSRGCGTTNIRGEIVWTTSEPSQDF